MTTGSGHNQEYDHQYHHRCHFFLQIERHVMRFNRSIPWLQAQACPNAVFSCRHARPHPDGRVGARRTCGSVRSAQMRKTFRLGRVLSWPGAKQLVLGLRERDSEINAAPKADSVKLLDQGRVKVWRVELDETHILPFQGKNADVPYAADGQA